MTKMTNADVNYDQIRLLDDMGSDDLILDGGISLPGRVFTFSVPGGISVGGLDDVRTQYKSSDDTLPSGIIDIADVCLDILHKAEKIDRNWWAVVNVSLDQTDADMFYVHLVSDDVVSELAEKHGISIGLQTFFPDWSLGYELENALAEGTSV
jgi:hypothetical protein